MQIVFKGNTDSGRKQLFHVGLGIYREAGLFEQIFGMNYSQYVAKVNSITLHSNVHNAYLQILLTMGLKGIVFLGIVLFGSIVLGIKTIKDKTAKNYKNILAVMLALNTAPLICMLTTTGALFASSIDSYFLTLCAIIIPKYVCNAIRSGTFEE